MNFEKAMVCGAGTMGHGIAHVLALSGREVYLYDIQPEFVDQGIEKIRANLEKGVARGKVDGEQAKQAMGRITGGTSLKGLGEIALLVEAIPESLELKKSLLKEFDEHANESAVFATNTSSLSIDAIAAGSRNPKRVVGMHFFNPVHIMKLVEVVRGKETSGEVVEKIRDLAKEFGKTPITVKDAPGFASSRLGIAIGMEAIRMLEEDVATAEDIDTAMKLGYGFPMGPLELTDLVGLDVRLQIAEYLEMQLGERFSPPGLLREKVATGALGRKSGEGFYQWQDGKKLESIS